MERNCKKKKKTIPRFSKAAASRAGHFDIRIDIFQKVGDIVVRLG